MNTLDLELERILLIQPESKVCLYDIQANSTLSAIKSYQNAILSTAPYALETHDPNIVPVGNGLYNKKTKQLEPFVPIILQLQRLQQTTIRRQEIRHPQ